MENNVEYLDKHIYNINDAVGDYLLEERLGSGLTFKALRKKDSRDVVVKIFLNSLNDKASRKIYENEIRAREVAGNIPGILKILDKGENSADNYIVTEFVESGSLADFLKDKAHSVSIKEILMIFSLISEALDRLHDSGVIHRDIKPENVLLRIMRNEYDIFIADFGFAKFVDSSKAFMTDSYAGTGQYSPPEAYSNDPKTVLIDNYAFGVMLYEAFEGKTPFEKMRMPPEFGGLVNEPVPYPEKTRQKSTKGVADLVLWLMSDSPNERPKTTKEVMDLIEIICDTKDEDEKRWLGRKFKNYIILKILYKGRISPTLLALDILSRIKVVLKSFDKDSLKGDAKTIYENEMNTLTKLEHEHHILMPRESFEQDGIFFIVTDYQDGGTLRTLLETKPTPTIKVVLDIFAQIAEAIDFVHKQGVVHRDIKPENIVYRKTGERYEIYLTDFGIAKILDSSSASFSTQFKDGTWLYMAPEVWTKDARKTRAIDIYALGIMLYEIFEGGVPFTGTETELFAQHMNASVPDFKNEIIQLRPDAKNLIISMLAKNPDDRPKSAVKAINKLKRIITHRVAKKEELGSVVTDPTTPSTTSYQPNQNALTYTMWGIILGVLVIGSIFFGPNDFFSIIPAQTALTETATFMPTSTEVVSTTTITATPTLGSIIRITSTVPTTPVANIKNQSGSECFNGPSDKYRRAPNVPANAQVYVIGRNSDTRDWFMIDGPTGRCWIRSSDLSYEFDPDSLFLIPTSITKTASVCRTGPDVGYREQTFIPQDRRIVIIGKNNLEADWLLVTPHDSTKPCWVRSTLFSNGADLSRIPLEETPDPPTSTVIAVASTKGAGGGGGGRSTPTPGGGGTTPNPPTRTSEPEPTATLCWPPGHCK